MAMPFPVLQLRDGFTGQNEHLRPFITELQQLLNDVSEFTVKVDGWYGNDSAAVVRVLQRRYGFYDDGVVRPALVRWLRHLEDHPEERVEPAEGVTLVQLLQIVGERNEAHARRHLDGLNAAMKTYAITTPLRRAHFLAQVAHESGGFRFSEELWGPTDAQRRYEGRADLGNDQPGDGFRFRGRGLIQLTGRANYRAYTRHRRALGDADVDFEATPDLVGQPPLAADVAGWYWDSRGVNDPADRDDVEAVTRKINGGLNGLDDRKRYLRLAKQALGA
ncbi:MAG TPA: peptidoglycan-binding protein [Rubricoccaceae bacterium]|nr:peptidoglycan-binding protein [Rubricoccaceae bacterium]